jgi:hypothetical protein
MCNDQKDILRVFNAHGVEYLIVGGHTVSQHAEPRATKDLDVFIRNDARDAELVFQALAEYVRRWPALPLTISAVICGRRLLPLSPIRSSG